MVTTHISVRNKEGRRKRRKRLWHFWVLVTDKREDDNNTFHCENKWNIQSKITHLKGQSLPVVLQEIVHVHSTQGLRPKGTEFGNTNAAIEESKKNILQMLNL